MPDEEEEADEITIAKSIFDEHLEDSDSEDADDEDSEEEDC